MANRRLTSRGAARPGTLHGQVVDILPVAVGGLPIVVACVPRLGRDAAQGDQHFAFDPVRSRPGTALAERAHPEPFSVGQDAHLVDGPAQKQREDRVAGFMVGGRLVVGRLHAFTVAGPEGGTNASPL